MAVETNSQGSPKNLGTLRNTKCLTKQTTKKGEDRTMRKANELRNESVSWGTMREEDLIPTFLSVIESCDHDEVDDLSKEWRRLQVLKSELSDTDPDPKYPTLQIMESVSIFLNEGLWGAMEDLAPDGCYFGANEGDGSDFGFWEYPDDEEC
jgi:hypothetical protein